MRNNNLKIHRREFLKAIGLGGMFLGCNGLKMKADKRRPNVLLIICDDLNDWAIHPPGHPKAKTPNMDRLCKRSMNFVNAHVVVPVCGPSRKCLFSGLYPQVIKDYGFTRWKDSPLLQDKIPMQLYFCDNGYRVYGTGKLFHEGAGGDFYTEYGIGPEYGPWPWKGEGRTKYTPHPAQFKVWEPYLPENMHRDLNYGPLSNIPDWKADSTKDIPGAHGWFNTNGKPFRYVNNQDRDQMPDEISANWAVDILNKKHESPFFLGVGFIRPHTPLYAPQKYFDMFPLEDIELPPYLNDDLDDCASILRQRWQWGFKKYEALIQAGGERAWKEWVQAYLACIAFVDDQIGKILDALDASVYKDNTIVVLTGDNGYHVGEKDCIQKWHLWDESTRVPLYIHVPNGEGNGQSTSLPVSLIDLYPTLADFCGLPVQPHMKQSHVALDGQSLRPLLETPDCEDLDGRSVVLMAIRDDKEIPHFSVRSQRYRYTLCSNGEEELYDHEKDPNEWTNLAGNPGQAKIKEQLREELLGILHATNVPPGYTQK